MVVVKVPLNAVPLTRLKVDTTTPLIVVNTMLKLPVSVIQRSPGVTCPLVF